MLRHFKTGPPILLHGIYDDVEEEEEEGWRKFFEGSVLSGLPNSKGRRIKKKKAFDWSVDECDPQEAHVCFGMCLVIVPITL